MGIGAEGALQGLLLDPIPVPAFQFHELDRVDVDPGSELGDVHEEREEPPLPDERDVVFGGQQGKEDADGVGGGQEVYEEEVVGAVVGAAAGVGRLGGMAGYE